MYFELQRRTCLPSKEEEEEEGEGDLFHLNPTKTQVKKPLAELNLGK